MSLNPDHRLAHFTITAKLGEGGMGEVYHAADSKLGRDVAIKVLPALVAEDPDRLGRFQREAKVLASLNHPSIAGIYQVEEAPGPDGPVHFLVMELVPGEDLSQRIARGRIPPSEAVPIALQIAEALEAAHDRGIIHRDLKPANIKVTPRGQVKVLDFGLAKALEEAPDGSTPSTSLSLSPTLTAQATQAGILLGTAAYMSPEQARGDAADRRADIWSFGVVLFEMLSGETVYRGRTVSDVLAGILAREPEWEKLPAGVPRPLRRLLERCLHKEASERLQAIGEARIRLRRFQENPDAVDAGDAAAAGAAAQAAAGSRGPGKLALAALALLLVGVTAAATWLLRPQPPGPEPIHVEATVEAGRQLMTGIGSSVVLSPDGKHLVYITGDGSNPNGQMHLRPTHGLEARVLTDVERGYHPFFSPDGRWIGYVTPQQLMKVAVSGGTPLELATVARSRGAAWGPDDTIVYTPDPTSGLFQISAGGGEPKELTKLEEEENSHRWPQFLPGGRHVLFTAYRSTDRNAGTLKVVDRETGEVRTVHEGGTYGRYVATGDLLYWRDGTVFAAPLDLASMQLTELPVPVLQEVIGNIEGGAQFDVSQDGTLAYLHGTVDARAEIPRKLQIVDREGQVTRASEIEGQFGFQVEVSPDGNYLVLNRAIGGNSDIWILDRQRDTPTRLTFGEDADFNPKFSADGAWVYWSSRRGGLFQVYRKPADGSREAEAVLETDGDQFLMDVSSDGRHLLYTTLGDKTQEDIWTLDLERGEPTMVLGTPFAEDDPRFSPDVRWMAYASNESGQEEVYVRPFPGPGGKWQVSSGGGAAPRWSTDGKTLFYLDRHQLLEASIEPSGDGLKVGRPRKVTELANLRASAWTPLSDDEFLFIQEPEGLAGPMDGGEAPELVRFTFFWFEELKRQLRSGG